MIEEVLHGVIEVQVENEEERATKNHHQIGADLDLDQDQGCLEFV